ncbi:TetR family transcriptional regulator [Heyndrickxia ginsengihumi]|uniref:TetR family transcriptional regulator n=1 Tax=Heyndrickxia ginsengihumi TaxID=363870 RepID=UPI003D23E93B
MALKKDQIIDEALQLLKEDGLEGVTLRKLAKRLAVQPSALYWHFKNKEILINEMAESILQKEFRNIEEQEKGETWQERLLDIFRRLRKALLSYTDAGRIVASSQASSMMARITEMGIKILINEGISLHKSRLIVLTATKYTFGYVIEEQIAPSPESFQHFDLEAFKMEHPLMVKGIEEYFASGRTVDDNFNDGLKIILGFE